MIDDYLIEPDLTETDITKSYQPKHTKRKPKKVSYFIKGPIDWEWICSAAKCSGKALQVALALHFLSGMKYSDTVKLPNKIMLQLGVDRHSKYRAIKTLEDENLITVVRKLGNAPLITII